MDRSQLRFADLKRRVPANARMMNVKVPVYVSDAIARLARDLGASKTEIVIALLNSGLEKAAKLPGPLGQKRK